MTEQTQQSQAKDETGCVIDEDNQIEEVLAALKNERCRKIMRETDQETLSADELSERCEIPLSTVYRVVQRLVEVGVLEKRVRLSSYPQYTHEYALVAETVRIDIGGESVLSLSVSRQSEISGGSEQPNQQLSAD
ncbi:helix-turn-helix domain-containing protein [Halovenus sp. HT40]|uniref:helix-turn-helix domain-containing protein n=1 Tax=Halovenus sp. HT40 TaxID=3126691 RepID=UPI00300EF865